MSQIAANGAAAGPNAETTEAWDGPLYERFVRLRTLMTDGLGAHGEAALERMPPRLGQRVLDIGCGFGDTTQRIAGIVGLGGPGRVRRRCGDPSARLDVDRLGRRA